MKCHDVRAQLSLIRPDSRDAEQPEFASEMMHLEQCADCQAYWAAQQQADRELGQAMRNVAIPADFKSRLLAQLSATINATPAEAPTAIPAAREAITTETALPTTVTQPLPRTRPADRVWTRRRAATVTSAALLLLAFGSWIFFNSPRQVQLSIIDVLALSQSPNTASRFQQTFQPELPATEIYTPNGTNSMLTQSFQYRGHEVGALFRYKVRLSPKSVQNAVLIVIDLKRAVISNLSSVSDSFVAAEVEYPAPNLYATRVWRVGQNLYVCYVQSKSPENLERLKLPRLVS